MVKIRNIMEEYSELKRRQSLKNVTLIEKENVPEKLEEIIDFLSPLYGLDKNAVKGKMPKIQFDSDGYALYYHENNLIVIPEKSTEDEIVEETAHFLHYSKNPNIFAENKIAIHTFFELVSTYARFIYFAKRGEGLSEPDELERRWTPPQHIRAYEMAKILFETYKEEELSKIASLSLKEATEYGKKYGWDLEW